MQDEIGTHIQCIIPKICTILHHIPNTSLPSDFCHLLNVYISYSSI